MLFYFTIQYYYRMDRQTYKTDRKDRMDRQTYKTRGGGRKDRQTEGILIKDQSVGPKRYDRKYENFCYREEREDGKVLVQKFPLANFTRQRLVPGW